ncbi:MAG: glycosyltransferase family 2 protein [Methylococcales bacterium]|nr:glycosyltransferase family 2 protein [Methylococcales bacterium]
MKIWICIPVFNRVRFTLNCLATLNAQTFRNYTVVICDHGSTDGTSVAIREQFPDVVLLNADSSLWWTGAINRCVSHVLAHADAGDSLLTLNNDNELPADYLQNLAASQARYPGAIITSVIHDIKTGQAASTGYRINWLLASATLVDFERDHLPGDPDCVAVTQACGQGTLFPVQAFRDLGLYDEWRLPHYAADYDFTFRAARAGYPIYLCRQCKVYSYVEETGLVKVLEKFSLKSFIDYFTSIRSPGNLRVRWWYGWNNCPKIYLPTYLLLDFMRVFGSYFKKLIYSR